MRVDIWLTIIPLPVKLDAPLPVSRVSRIVRLFRANEIDLASVVRAEQKQLRDAGYFVSDDVDVRVGAGL